MERMMVMTMMMLTVVTLCSSSRPSYIGCQTSEECGKESCCVIGMGRYSVPQCQLRKEVAEGCRPQSKPVNTTLSYPDGVSVDLTQVYYIHCPCQVGLHCSGKEETFLCALNQENNHVYDYESQEYWATS